MALRVTNRKQFPLVLRDQAGTEMGLILCDRKGNPLTTSISQSSSPGSVLRISQGAPGYSDFELPYTPILQDSWSGGRGAKNFESATTRYAQSNGVDTSNGNIILQPYPYKLPTNIPWQSNYAAGSGQNELTLTPLDVYASSFVATRTETIRAIKLWLRMNGPDDETRVRIYQKAAGTEIGPGTLLYTSKYLKTVAGMNEITVPVSLAVTAGQEYFVGIKSDFLPGGGEDTTIVTRTGVTGGAVWRQSSGVGAWSVLYSGRILKFSFSSDGPGRHFFFKLRGLTHCAKAYDDGTATRIFRNGVHGYAQAGSTIHNVVTNWDLSGLENFTSFKNIRILAGRGSLQERPARRVYDFGSGYVSVRTDEFDVAPDATSEIVMDGFGFYYNPANQAAWVEVTSPASGLTTVTDVVVVGSTVYFAQGPDANMRRLHFNGSAYEWADDGTNRADYLLAVPKTTGGYKVWKALARTGVVASADTAAWGTNLIFADSNGGKMVTRNDALITGMAAYGVPTMPYIFYETGFGSINNDVFYEMPISNLIATLQSPQNGRYSGVSDVYLFFSMQGGRLERYYDQHLDDVGVDRDEGLPDDLRGEVSGILTLPGRIIISINSEFGYSSIYQNNGQGWHELYRSPVAARRIRGIAYQQGDGGTGRILISEDGEVWAINYDWNPSKRISNNLYPYKLTGNITSSRIYGSMRDVRKFFKGMSLFSENLAAATRSVQLEYRTDEDPTWRSATRALDVSMIDKAELSVDNDVSGRWIEYRLTLSGANVTGNGYIFTTPIVDALLLDSITRVPPKDSWTLYFLLDDTLRDYTDKAVKKTAQEYINQVRDWSDSRTTPCPLKMTSTIPAFNDKLVVIEPGSFAPLEIQELGLSGELVRTKMLGQIRVMEV